MFFRRLNWNIVGWFRTIQTISYLVIAIGIGAMVYHGFEGGNGFQPSHMLRLGLAFTGGTEVDVAFTQPVTTDAVKNALALLNLADESINTVGSDGKHFTIDTTTSFANNSVPLKNALNKAATIDPSQLSITAIGPTLGGEYLRDALYALVLALGIQFVYIAFRFGWNYIFGLVTVIALVRDAAMMIGIYAIADRPADDAFLAAVLTVIGYSVMDTIVILDRIRENTKLMVGVSYDTIVNESIKQTMTRSFNTLATVVITLVALLALGGASLKNFAFALLVGICSGGYHSIFYSAPLVLVFRKRQLEQAARKRRAALSVAGPAPARVEGASSNRGSREDIVAARRARRAAQKTSARNPQTASGRYRRKREESGAVETLEPAEADEIDNLEPLEHEEIKLNLEGFEVSSPEHEPDGTHQE
ncbi:MAG TPA: protein translocase subunit SecF [Candidatus Acidoferrales bacterium]|nr:protein translocase subunit SecF [Candidatus Acidoferrales bacterium]